MPGSRTTVVSAAALVIGLVCVPILPARASAPLAGPSNVEAHQERDHVRVGFTPPADLTNITKIEVVYAETAPATPADGVVGASATTGLAALDHLDVPDLVPGSYGFSVFAIGTAEEHTDAVSDTATVVADGLEPVTASSITSSGLTVSGTAVTGATSYVARVLADGAFDSTTTPTTTAVASNSSSQPSVDVAGLAAATAYDVVLFPLTDDGWGAPAKVDVTTLPSSATGLSLQQRVGVLRATWTAPTDPPSSYTVGYKSGGTPTSKTDGTVATTTQTTYDVPLTAAGTVGVAVYAETATATAAAVTATTTVLDPSASATISPGELTDTTVALSWTAVAGASAYRVVTADANAPAPDDPTLAGTQVTGRSFTVTALAPSTSYRFFVVPVTASGWGKAASAVVRTRDWVVASGFGCAGTSTSAIGCQWSSASWASSYKVLLLDARTAPAAPTPSSPAVRTFSTTSATSRSFTGLPVDTRYKAALFAYTSSGGWVRLDVVEVKTMLAPVTSATITQAGSNLRISWAAPAQLPDRYTYVVYARPLSYGSVASVSTPDRSATLDTGPGGGPVDVVIKVVRVDAFGSETYDRSEERTFRFVKTSFSYVNLKVATPSSRTSALVTWDDIPAAVDFSVTVTADGASTPVVSGRTAGLSYTAKGLKPGTRYAVRVRAQTPNGWFASATTHTVTAVTDPTSITAKVDTAGTGSVVVTWTAAQSPDSWGVCVSETRDFDCTEAFEAGGTKRTKRLSAASLRGLPAGKTNYVHIRAYDELQHWASNDVIVPLRLWFPSTLRAKSVKAHPTSNGTGMTISWKPPAQSNWRKVALFQVSRGFSAPSSSARPVFTCLKGHCPASKVRTGLRGLKPYTWWVYTYDTWGHVSRAAVTDQPRRQGLYDGSALRLGGRPTVTSLLDSSGNQHLVRVSSDYVLTYGFREAGSKSWHYTSLNSSAKPEGLALLRIGSDRVLRLVSYRGGYGEVMRTKRPGHGWSDGHRVSTASYYAHDLQVDPAGGLHVLLLKADANASSVRYTRALPGSTTFSAPVVLHDDDVVKHGLTLTTTSKSVVIAMDSSDYGSVVTAVATLRATTFRTFVTVPGTDENDVPTALSVRGSRVRLFTYHGLDETRPFAYGAFVSAGSVGGTSAKPSLTWRGETPVRVGGTTSRDVPLQAVSDSSGRVVLCFVRGQAGASDGGLYTVTSSTAGAFSSKATPVRRTKYAGDALVQMRFVSGKLRFLYLRT